jgi:hypothetical protein
VWFRSSPTRRPALRVEPSGAVVTSRFDSLVRRRGRALLRIAASSRSTAWVAGLALFDGIAGACSPTATPRSDGVARGGWSPAKLSSSNLWASWRSSALSGWKDALLSVGYNATESSDCHAQKSIRPKSSRDAAHVHELGLLGRAHAKRNLGRAALVVRSIYIPAEALFSALSPACAGRGPGIAPSMPCRPERARASASVVRNGGAGGRGRCRAGASRAR